MTCSGVCDAASAGCEKGDEPEEKTLDVPADLLRSASSHPMEGTPPSSRCCVAHQVDFFKTKHPIEVSEDIFKQNNVFTALNVHVMMSAILSWLENPVTFWEIWEEETHPHYKGLLA